MFNPLPFEKFHFHFRGTSSGRFHFHFRGTSSGGFHFHFRGTSSDSIFISIFNVMLISKVFLDIYTYIN